MAKRRPLIEPLEDRLCMAAPVLQAAVSLPSSGSWTATPYRASPIMADIFNTGKDDLITVTTGAQLVAYAAGANNSLTPVVTYQVPAGVADIKSTPIVVTNPQTHRKDLFAAMGRDETTNTLNDGRVFGWDLQTGQLLAGWTLGQSSGVASNFVTGAYGPLTSGVLEGNGMPDIVVTSFSAEVTAFRLDGSMIWQWTNDDTIISGAVVADIDRSGTPSVIVGGDSSNSPFYQAGGWVNVLSNTGVLKWRHFIAGETTWASPIVADLNNNGYLDIVIGTGENYDFAGVAGARAAGNYLYAFDPFGNVLPGWPYHLTSNDAVAHEVLQSVAAADLLGNGQLDIVAIDRAGYLHAISPTGQDLPGFAGGINIASGLSAAQVPDDYASPIIADVNGDGKPDIIAEAADFVRAYDSSGNLIWSVTTNKVGDLPEGIDAAAVVGNMNGGPNGTLAYVTYNTTQSNRPDQLFTYLLPQTTLVAPWPSERRNAAGDAVLRSATFDHGYVALAFQGAIGYIPPAVTVNAFDSALDADTLDLTQIANYIFNGPLTLQAQVTNVYQALLGHAPDANAISVWSNYLATNSVRNMELLLVNGPEFASVSGNTLAGEVARMYQAFLGRTASQAEINAWVGSGLSVVSTGNTIINSTEGVNRTVTNMFTSVFGTGALGYLSADTVAAFAYDYHRGLRESDIKTHLVADNGNYAASNFQASYLRDLYRDILHRQAQPSETASWLQALDNNSLAITQIPLIILNSTEARGVFVQQEFVALLGRAATATEVAGLSGYSTREALILTLVTSAEYITHNGGTIPSYISAVSRDLAGISPVPTSQITAYSNEFAAGAPLATLALNLMSNPALYDNQMAVTEIMQYVPDESQGVLRSGNQPITATTVASNPSPALIATVVSLMSSGATDEQIISNLLTSSTYVGRVTYNKGIYRSPGIRS